MKIGDKIRNAREDMDMSQNDVSKLIPMNQSNYSKIERDMQEPNLEQLRSICQILRLNPAYLLGISEGEQLTPEDLQLLRDIRTLIKKYSQPKP